MRHLMSPLDLSKEELDDLLTLASDIEKNPKKYAHVCDDKRLATCFYEPSTRTRLSFEAAMMNLGGKVLGFSSAGSSSAAKGESVHSLIEALVLRYSNVKFVLISPEELRVPSYIREDILEKNNVEFEEVERLEDALPKLDILYMTRVQKERFFNEEDYVRMKDFYILDKQKMELAPKDMYILHPLPRVNEIAVEVDDDPRAAYFKQAQYGVYVRMALILRLLEVEV